MSVVKDYLTFILLFITTDLFSITIFILLLLKISKHLSLIALSLLVSFVIVSLVFKNIQKQKTKLLYQNEEQVNSYLIEALSSVDAIKGMHIEKSVIKRFMFKYKKFLAAIYSLSLTTEVITFLKNSLYSIFIVAILYCGSVEVIKNSLTLSDLIVFQSIFNFYIQSFQNLITLITKYPEYKVSTERIEDLFTIKKEAFQGNQYYKQYNLKGDIIYHDLTYAYNHKVLLNQINLVIHAKDKIFISGPSGAGKSTLVKLLMRYIEVPFQKISINGIDINHYHLNVIRQRITYVSQQEFLFNDTIYHNISLYQDCSKTEVEKVMNLALIDKEFSLDQTVEENGFNFSGGERQRLIIARSILKKSDIYIFDESFSQIDVVREKKILSNILNYLKEKTVIVISHRFDNKDLFDRILCLKNGKIYEEKL